MFRKELQKIKKSNSGIWISDSNEGIMSLRFRICLKTIRHLRAALIQLFLSSVLRWMGQRKSIPGALIGAEGTINQERKCPSNWLKAPFSFIWSENRKSVTRRLKYIKFLEARINSLQFLCKQSHHWDLCFGEGPGLRASVVGARGRV